MIDDRIGKYIRYNNGLRCKVISRHPRYPADFVLEAVDGSHQWPATELTVSESAVITEEEAKKQHAEVRIDVPQTAPCSCCNWRVGKPNVSIKLSLAGGSVPVDEADRIRKEIATFFVRHGIVPRVHRTATGVDLEFISLIPIDKPGNEA